MNTFFRIAVYLSFAMIIFNLVIAFVSGLNAFPVEGIPGTGAIEETNALSTLTGLTGGMEGLWLGLMGLGLFGAGVAAILTRSLIPVGIYLFSAVFWTAYLKSNSILTGTGGFIPGDFLGIFFVCMIFLFIAAVIGMLTGSG